MLVLCEETRCRRQALLVYLDEETSQPCGHRDDYVDDVETWDAAESAHQALSAIYRSGQRYGVGHLVDILFGRKTEKVRSLDHQHLAVFGIDKRRGEGEWWTLFRQLVARGLADVDLDGFGGLHLTEVCHPLLCGEARLELRRDLKPQRAKGSSSGGASAASQLVRSEERGMWEAPHVLRCKLAERHSVSPYVIFPNAALLEMLRSQSRSLSDMAQVSGVGARELERHDQAFLDVLTDLPAAPAVPPQDLHHELTSLVYAGMTPAQIARQLNCDERNVCAMLAEVIAGQQVSPEQALDLLKELLGEIQDAFLEEDGELPPAVALGKRFGKRVPGGVLHCVRAALQVELES